MLNASASRAPRGAALPRHPQAADGTRDVERAGAKFNLSDVSVRLGWSRWPPRRMVPRARAPRLLYFACLEARAVPARVLPPRHNPGHSWNMFTALLPLRETGTTRKASSRRCAEGVGIGVSYEAIQLTTQFPTRVSRRHFPFRSARARDGDAALVPEMQESDVERRCEATRRVIRGKSTRENRGNETNALRLRPSLCCGSRSPPPRRTRPRGHGHLLECMRLKPATRNTRHACAKWKPCARRRARRRAENPPKPRARPPVKVQVASARRMSARRWKH